MGEQAPYLLLFLDGGGRDRVQLVDGLPVGEAIGQYLLAIADPVGIDQPDPQRRCRHLEKESVASRHGVYHRVETEVAPHGVAARPERLAAGVERAIRIEQVGFHRPNRSRTCP